MHSAGRFYPIQILFGLKCTALAAFILFSCPCPMPGPTTQVENTKGHDAYWQLRSIYGQAMWDALHTRTREAKVRLEGGRAPLLACFDVKGLSHA